VTGQKNHWQRWQQTVGDELFEHRQTAQTGHPHVEQDARGLTNFADGADVHVKSFGAVKTLADQAPRTQ
jgi:hypothetical protein